MNDEIKEILRNCEKAINEASGYNNTTDKILDYITNLQQEINKLTAESTEWESKYYDLQQENERLKLNHKQLKDIEKMATSNSKLIQENEKLKELSFRQHEEYEKLFNHLIIDKPRERIKKAINIYDNRNSLKYKKQRFMQGKTTADLMYEALQNGSDEE